MGAAAALPAPLQVLDLEMSDGARIRVRRHGDPDGPRVLVSHGNGFATDGYFPLWRHLLDDFEVVVYDQRNHGQNPLHEREAHGVPRFAEDLECLLAEIARAWGAKTPFGVFHSLSAIVAVAHALSHPWPWGALVLFDPPFCPEPDHRLYAEARVREKALSDHAAGRRSEFPRPELLAEKFAQAMPGPGWVEGAALGMARAVLRERAGGSFELACPGPYEAQIFAENSKLQLTPRLGELPGPVLFLCADPEAPGAGMPAQVNRDLHRRFGHDYEAPPGTSHMLMLEQPEACAQRVRRYLATAGEAPAGR